MVDRNTEAEKPNGSGGPPTDRFAGGGPRPGNLATAPALILRPRQTQACRETTAATELGSDERSENRRQRHRVPSGDRLGWTAGRSSAGKVLAGNPTLHWPSWNDSFVLNQDWSLTNLNGSMRGHQCQCLPRSIRAPKEDLAPAIPIQCQGEHGDDSGGRQNIPVLSLASSHVWIIPDRLR
jgi:hypothetical protein